MMGLLPNLIRRLRSFDIERLREGPKCCYHWAGGGRQGGQRWDALLQRAKDRGGGREEEGCGLAFMVKNGEWLMACGKRVCRAFCFESAPGSANLGVAAVPSGCGVIKLRSQL